MKENRVPASTRSALFPRFFNRIRCFWTGRALLNIAFSPNSIVVIAAARL